ncbi:MAG: nuclear transport factor 2 family protein [Ferruginibacter sp.]
MKKTINKYLLLAGIFIMALNNQLGAQKLDADAVAFTKTYQDSYNKGDLSALMTMYADEINVVYSDGKEEKVPKSEYEADYIRDFGEAAGTYLDFKVTKTEALPDGKVKIMGSFDGYDFDRKSNTKLNPAKGTFENIIVKNGGAWKYTQLKVVYAMTQVWKDVRVITQSFQDAYNKEDAAALKAMFTADAQNILPDGKTIKGAVNVAADYAEAFKNANVSITIKPANVQPQFDGSMIATGTFSLYGTSVKGDRIAFSGSFANKLVSQNGQWKLAEIKQSGLVKTIVYHKVADFAKWKTGFDAFRRLRLDSGELTFEVGTLADDSTTVYVINEWASAEKAKAFFALPELATAMQKLGVTETPHFMYLNKK